MLEITGEDISKLNDIDLRSLIGLLCEVDLREQNIPTAGVTWGGHQNAKDGGIDVRVELTSTLVADGFIPRSNTGFQVKKPDMPRSEILGEMKPNGELRDVIRDLIDIKGAYIIVSSQGSTADSALTSRRETMEEAISNYPNHFDFKVDFYDRERVAGWVRQHPTLILWVRKKIGEPIQGWQSYDNWSRCPYGIEEEYIVDDHIRLYSSVNTKSDGFSATEGINEVRSLLHKPTSSVRLVGLSGVGKTRLLQALFDERIGNNPLNRDAVYYTDISDSPNPDPRSFAEQILAFGKPAILAVDNCPPELHRSLTKICTGYGSCISLITVEYDVREDQPEETEVIRLEPSSTELIEKVIISRFDYISEVSARSIAEFSGGNARIANALAKTVKQGENLSAFKDDELFKRLFQQRNDPSNSLMKVAEVCSLVYSFNIQTSSDDEIELKLLSTLAEISERELHGNVRELKRRDLVQQRSVWRAVLPHAIANKLAERALQNIPVSEVCHIFEEGGSPRLLKSFSRRLSYLHESEEAGDIVNRWLKDGGILGDISNLSDLEMSMFTNIAPVNLELTLKAFEKLKESDYAERFFSRENHRYHEFTRTLRSIAYNEQFFERSASLLCKFAISEKIGENYNSIRDLLKSLFQLYLSGTHASPEQRLNVIRRLIEADSETENDLGVSLLDTTLGTGKFSSFYEFEFGAHPRDYGFSPKTTFEIQSWYRVFIDYIGDISISQSKLAMQRKKLLAENFRNLWCEVRMYRELEIVTERILEGDSWNEGWLAIKSMLKLDSDSIGDEDATKRIYKIEEKLRPRTLVNKALVYVLGDIFNLINLVDDSEDEYAEVERITQQLGKEVGSSYSVFSEISHYIVSRGKTYSVLCSLGRGLAEGTINPETIWEILCKRLSELDEAVRQYEVLHGFLFKLSEVDVQLSEKMLSEAVKNDILAPIYPELEIAIGVGAKGFERLKESVEYGEAPISHYTSLGRGNLSDIELVELLEVISTKSNGVEVAIEVISRKILNQPKEIEISDIIADFGRGLLLKYSFERRNVRDMLDYELAEIIRACLTIDSAPIIMKHISEKMNDSSSGYSFAYSSYKKVLKVLATKYPLVFLDTLFEKLARSNQIIRMPALYAANILSEIDDEILIEWVMVEKNLRISKVISMIRPYQNRKVDGVIEWTPLTMELIEAADDLDGVFSEMKKSFYPMSWSGSLASIMETRLPLIVDLQKHEKSEISEWAKTEEKVFQEAMNNAREREFVEERSENERYE